MTVRELIEYLSKQDQDLPVVYCDYEGGNMLVDGAETMTCSTWDDRHVMAVYLRSDSGAF